jgi:hypothetical protein
MYVMKASAKPCFHSIGTGGRRFDFSKPDFRFPDLGPAPFLDLVLSRGLGSKVSKRCAMRLMVASIFLPFTSYARYRGRFSVDQFDLNSHGTPFGTGSFFLLKSLGSEQSHCSNSACNQSAAIDPCVVDDPVVCDWQGHSKSTLGIP